MRLGEMLSLARELKGMTIRNLSTKSGVSNPLICQIELGRVKNPGWKTVVKLATALNIPLDRLTKLD